jgi:hypothetical protein
MKKIFLLIKCDRSKSNNTDFFKILLDKINFSKIYIRSDRKVLKFYYSSICIKIYPLCLFFQKIIFYSKIPIFVKQVCF